jgi:hypothetical protein
MPRARKKTGMHIRPFGDVGQFPAGLGVGLSLKGNNGWAKAFASVCGAIDPFYRSDSPGNDGFHNNRRLFEYCGKHDNHKQVFRKSHCGKP